MESEKELNQIPINSFKNIKLNKENKKEETNIFCTHSHLLLDHSNNFKYIKSFIYIQVKFQERKKEIIITLGGVVGDPGGVNTQAK